MKIKTINKNKNKLLKLKIFQTKIYNKEQYLNNIKIEEIEYRLKKISHIIYKYHNLNKTILFVGIPLNVLKIKKLSKNNQHIFLPSNIWLRGAIYNKQPFFRELQKNKKPTTNKVSKLIFQLKKNIDLIIVFDETTNLGIINESYLTRIPTIALNSDLNIQFEKPSYKVPGNFKFISKKLNILSKIHNYFIYSIIISLLQRNHKNKKNV